jgi:hypothetical protein
MERKKKQIDIFAVTYFTTTTTDHSTIRMPTSSPVYNQEEHAKSTTIPNPRCAQSICQGFYYNITHISELALPLP